MKKLALATGVFFIFIFSSCRKDYTCQCTTENPLGGDDIVLDRDITEAKKSEAEDLCAEFEDSNTSCELQ